MFGKHYKENKNERTRGQYMLEKVKAYALEKYAGDKQMADEFVRGFTKAANSRFDQKSAADKLMEIRGRGIGAAATAGLGKGFGESLGKLLITTGVGALGAAANSINHDRLRTKFLQALEYVLVTNPIVKEEAIKGARELESVKEYAETIFRFAPDIAADRNLLSTVLANAVHGSGIDPTIIKTVTDLQRTYRDNTTFTPKSYI